MAAVVKRAQGLDYDAFETLDEEYPVRLDGFLCRLTGRRDEAEDFVQEVFVRVVRAISQYEEDGRFEAWIFRIALNLARDRDRQAGQAPAGFSARR